jgi:hypothetical protein
MMYVDQEVGLRDGISKGERVVMLEFKNVNIGITDALNECQQVQL